MTDRNSRGGVFLVSMLRASWSCLISRILVVGVEDGEVGLQADQFGVAAQHARARGVKGSDPPAFDRTAEQRRDALAHLARRLVGEGDREHLPGPRPAGGEDVREPRGQHPRFAGAGPRQHQHRPLRRLYRLGLRVIEALDVR